MRDKVDSTHPRPKGVSLPLTGSAISPQLYEYRPLLLLCCHAVHIPRRMALHCLSPPQHRYLIELTWAGYQSGQQILGCVWLVPTPPAGAQAGMYEANQGLPVLVVSHRTPIENRS